MAWPNGNENILNNGDLEIKAEWDHVAWEVEKNIGSQLTEIFENDEKIVIDTKIVDNFLWRKKERILDYLKKNCFYKKEDVDKSWEEWIHYYLILPSVKWSECKKIDWFISYKKVTKKEYEGNQTWIDNSSEIEDVATKLYWNMRDFLKCLGVSEDEGWNFVKRLNALHYGIPCCDTWKNVKNVTGLNQTYWLKNIDWNIRAVWTNEFNDCCFGGIRRDEMEARLLQWLDVKIIE